MAQIASRETALRQGLRLEYVTVAWMAIEAILAIGAGIVARSVLLTAFGADSLIELISGVTLLWRLRAERNGTDSSLVDSVEKRAEVISSALLVLLCVYVAASAVAGLAVRIEPERSWVGIAVSAAAVIAMPWLASRKRIVNRTLASPALRADIAESITCAFLAGVTLVGISIDAVTGWWWVEYMAAVGLLFWLIPEAREALQATRRTESDSDHSG